MKFYNNAHQLT